MIGLAIGAAALFGILFHKVRRHHMYAHAYGHGCHGHGHWHGYHGHGYGAPWAMGRRGRYYHLLAALDLSPAQDKVVRGEIDALRDKLRDLRGEPGATRADLGRAFGGAVFDRAPLDEAFARHDQAFVDLRAQVTGALERIHAALDDDQRAKLAELIGKGRGRGWGAGPYRM